RPPRAGGLGGRRRAAGRGAGAGGDGVAGKPRRESGVTAMKTAGGARTTPRLRLRSSLRPSRKAGFAVGLHRRAGWALALLLPLLGCAPPLPSVGSTLPQAGLGGGG